jgi:hypothetical protein
MAPKTRLSEALDQYLAHRASRFSATTVNADTYILRRFLAEVLGIVLAALVGWQTVYWTENRVTPE